MVGISVIPTKTQLVEEYHKHAQEYEWLNNKGQLDDWISEEEYKEFVWHRDEIEKLEKILNVLYSEW